MPPLQTTAYATMVGSLLFLPVSFLGENHLIFANLHWDFGFYMGFLILLSSVLSFLWWSQGVKYLGPTQTGMLTLLMPPFALLLSAVVLQQPITILQIIGIVLSLSGVSLCISLVKINFPLFLPIKFNKKG